LRGLNETFHQILRKIASNIASALIRLIFRFRVCLETIR